MLHPTQQSTAMVETLCQPAYSDGINMMIFSRYCLLCWQFGAACWYDHNCSFSAVNICSIFHGFIEEIFKSGPVLDWPVTVCWDNNYNMTMLPDMTQKNAQDCPEEPDKTSRHWPGLHLWDVTELFRSMSAPFGNPQDIDDPLLTPCCRKPQDIPRCVHASMVRAKPNPWWGSDGLDLF